VRLREESSNKNKSNSVQHLVFNLKLCNNAPSSHGQQQQQQQQLQQQQQQLQQQQRERALITQASLRMFGKHFIYLYTLSRGSYKLVITYSDHSKRLGSRYICILYTSQVDIDKYVICFVKSHVEN